MKTLLCCILLSSINFAEKQERMRMIIKWETKITKGKPVAYSVHKYPPCLSNQVGAKYEIVRCFKFVLFFYLWMTFHNRCMLTYIVVTKRD